MIRGLYLKVFQEKLTAYFVENDLNLDISRLIKDPMSKIDIITILREQEKILQKEDMIKLSKLLKSKKFQKIHSNHNKISDLIELPAFRDLQALLQNNRFIQTYEDMNQKQKEALSNKRKTIEKNKAQLTCIMQELSFDTSRLVEAIITHNGLTDQIQKLQEQLCANQFRKLQKILESEELKIIRANLQETRIIELQEKMNKLTEVIFQQQSVILMLRESLNNKTNELAQVKQDLSMKTIKFHDLQCYQQQP